MPDVQLIKKQLHMQQWTAIIEEDRLLKLWSAVEITSHCLTIL